MMSTRNPPHTWRGGDVEFDAKPLRSSLKCGSQTSREAGDARRSLAAGEAAHVRDCLIWNNNDGPPINSAELRQREKDRVKRWWCICDNRCNETFYRRKFCRENHCKNGMYKNGRRPSCPRCHCPQRPCVDEDCAGKHCRDDDCPDRAGCHEQNCRTCRGLDARIDRDIGYVRRIELGRPKDRGLQWDWDPTKYRASNEDGSAAEAMSGWPKPIRKHRQLEPLPRRDAGQVENTSDVDAMMKRKLQLETGREPEMSTFTNGTKPKVLTFRDQDEMMTYNNNNNTQQQRSMVGDMSGQQQNLGGNPYNYNNNDGGFDSLSELQKYRQAFPRVAQNDPADFPGTSRGYAAPPPGGFNTYNYGGPDGGPSYDNNNNVGVGGQYQQPEVAVNADRQRLYGNDAVYRPNNNGGTAAPVALAGGYGSQPQQQPSVSRQPRNQDTTPFRM